MFRFIFTKQNVNEASDYIKLISTIVNKKDLGAGGYIEFAGLLAFDEIMNDYFLPELPQDVIKQIKEASKKYDLPVGFAHSNPKYRRSRSRCIAWVEPFIFVDGYVNPCCAQNEANKREEQKGKGMGNIFENPFKKIWNSKKYKDLRKNVTNPYGQIPDYCKGCRVTEMD